MPFRPVAGVSIGLAAVLAAFALACSPDISTPTYTVGPDGATVSSNRDFLMGYSPGTLPYDPIPPIPDGAVPPPGIIVPLGSVDDAAEALAPGECLLHFRRGPWGYTPVDFRLDTARFVENGDETAVVVMHLMRGEIIGKRAVCVIPRSEANLPDVSDQLRVRLRQPGDTTRLAFASARTAYSGGARPDARARRVHHDRHPESGGPSMSRSFGAARR